MAKIGIQDRIKGIQSRLGVKSDGIMGPATLTAVENLLFKDEGETDFSLIVSQKGLDLIVKHEISSKAYYRNFLSHPVWPGGASGVTIGIGYDLGHNTSGQILKDWGGLLAQGALDRLASTAGLRGRQAREALDRVKDIIVSLDRAREVFYSSTLPRYGARTRKAYPGVEKLFPDAQSAMLSLVYNRGASMAGSRRKEMAALKPLVIIQDYPAIADQILSMKRLWENKGLDGLLNRRDSEAALVLASDHGYGRDEMIRV